MHQFRLFAWGGPLPFCPQNKGLLTLTNLVVMPRYTLDSHSWPVGFPNLLGCGGWRHQLYSSGDFRLWERSFPKAALESPVHSRRSSYDLSTEVWPVLPTVQVQFVVSSNYAGQLAIGLAGYSITSSLRFNVSQICPGCILMRTSWSRMWVEVWRPLVE